MRNFLFTILTVSGTSIFAQSGNVGINTTSPAATLDIVGQPGNASKLDGVIAPRLTGDQLKAKSYTSAQTGALVYATSAAASPSGQTVNLTAVGYYYFDGSVWQAVKPAAGTDTSWKITGNSNIDSNTHYLGTSNGATLRFKSNNNYAGFLGFVNTGYGVNSLPFAAAGFPNSAFGANSLASNTSGQWNTSVGYNSLNSNTTGNFNTAVGDRALSSTTTAWYNTAVGYQTLQDNTGGWNTAVGGLALKANTTGNSNVAIGQVALTAVTDGVYNTGVGNAAMSHLTSGSYNTSIGGNSLSQVTTGSNNVAVGADNSPIMTGGSYNVIIGSGNSIGTNLKSGDKLILIGSGANPPSYNIGSTYSASNEMSIGNAIYGKNINDGNAANDLIGIQNKSPKETLDVGGNIRTVGTSQAITDGVTACTNTGTITFNPSDGNFYGCTGTASPGIWKKLNN